MANWRLPEMVINNFSDASFIKKNFFNEGKSAGNQNKIFVPNFLKRALAVGFRVCCIDSIERPATGKFPQNFEVIPT